MLSKWMEAPGFTAPWAAALGERFRAPAASPTPHLRPAATCGAQPLGCLEFLGPRKVLNYSWERFLQR